MVFFANSYGAKDLDTHQTDTATIYLPMTYGCRNIRTCILTIWFQLCLVSITRLGVGDAAEFSSDSSYDAYAYRGSSRWVEMNDATLVERTKNSGIVFSGGGARAFVSCMGQLRGLVELDVLKDVRYITGISGGGWATAAFSYRNSSMDTFLPPLVQPKNLTYADSVPEGAAYGFATANSALRILEHAVHGLGAYDRALQDMYLTPGGIPSDALMCWNEADLEDVRRRNPDLANTTFVCVKQDDGRPYPIFGATILAPTDYASDSCVTGRNYSLIEFAPDYVGTSNPYDVVYEYRRDFDGEKSSPPVRIGGAIENFAFGGVAPSTFLPANLSSGRLDVPVPESPVTLQRAIAVGSWAPGAFGKCCRLCCRHCIRFVFHPRASRPHSIRLAPSRVATTFRLKCILFHVSRARAA